jgi:hypothetical protein
MTIRLQELTSGEKTKDKATSAHDVLVRLISGVQLHRTADGPVFVEVPASERNETYGLKSRAFRDWLVHSYFAERGQPPSAKALAGILGVLEARARFLRTAPSVFVRVACDGNGDSWSQYIDLGDQCGRAIQIVPDGWSVIRRPRTRFRRPEGYLPLPMPQAGGALALLRPYVNLGESDFRLFVAWLTAAIRPAGPYPILALYGEQGSAKSTLAKVIRLLVDPHATPLLAEPRSTLDLMNIALNSWVLAFDNLSALPGWLSDSLCRLAVGGGCAARLLPHGYDVSYLNAQRPMVLNGITDFMARGDLIDRALVFNLPAISPANRRSEAEFWSSFRVDYPIILGALLDAVVLGLRMLPGLDLPELPRMADFALWGEAVGRGQGWPRATFLAAYARNRRAATWQSLEESPVADALLSRMADVERWTGSTTELQELLIAKIGFNSEARARWPKTIMKFGRELRRIAPQLRVRGINMSFSKNPAQRLVSITSK